MRVLENLSSIIISTQKNFKMYKHNMFFCRYLHVVGSKHLEEGDTKYLNMMGFSWQSYKQKLSDQRLSFDYIAQVSLRVRLWQYHWSNKQTVKCTCITQCNYTVHCTIRTRAQSVRRQHRKRTSEKSEMMTYKDTTQVAENMWVSFILI